MIDKQESLSRKKQIVQAGIDELELLDGTSNKTMSLLVNTVSSKIPLEMARTIANFTMSAFISHFHLKLDLEIGKEPAPLNVIGFILAKSGGAKTSTVESMESCFKEGKEELQAYRKKKNEDMAREMDTVPVKLPELEFSMSTVPGIVKALNKFYEEGLGLPSLVIDEVATAIDQTDFEANVELVSQLFDSGNFKVKALKGEEGQSDPVKGMGMPALFLGSEAGILLDTKVLHKFMKEILSKLARRAIFVYPDFTYVEQLEIIDPREYYKTKNSGTDKLLVIQNQLNSISKTIAENLMFHEDKVRKLDPEARYGYQLYADWCEIQAIELGEAKSSNDEAILIEQEHRHWKMLKLAGVYSVFNNHDHIELEDIKEAIMIVEATGSHLSKFLAKADKKPYQKLYELFINDKSIKYNLSDMLKMGLISRANQLSELLIEANSLMSKDEGYIEDVNGIIQLKELTKVDPTELGYMSFKLLTLPNANSISVDYNIDVTDNYAISKKQKELRAIQLGSYIGKKKVKWEHLIEALRNDCAYTPFIFRDDKRANDNIMNNPSWLVMDIDGGDNPSITEAYDNLQDYQAYLALTSDVNNIYKYRVLLKTDIELEVSSRIWKEFSYIVASDLGFNVDLLGKAQLFYGYAGRDVMITEGEPFEASKVLPQLISRTANKKIVKIADSYLLNEAYNNRRSLFKYAYDKDSGEGAHTSLYTACLHAIDLGFSMDMVESLVYDIVEDKPDKIRDSWIKPTIAQLAKRFEETELYNY